MVLGKLCFRIANVHVIVAILIAVLGVCQVVHYERLKELKGENEDKELQKSIRLLTVKAIIAIVLTICIFIRGVMYLLVSDINAPEEIHNTVPIVSETIQSVDKCNRLSFIAVYGVSSVRIFDIDDKDIYSKVLENRDKDEHSSDYIDYTAKQIKAESLLPILVEVPETIWITEAKYVDNTACIKGEQEVYISLENGNYVLNVEGQGKFKLGEYDSKQLSLKDKQLSINVCDNEISIAVVPSMMRMKVNVEIYYNATEELEEDRIHKDVKIVKIEPAK